ncbi:hypothetical protein CKA32_001830 [Geitlerinema sp. FC II]|nr:hypothetical protein CKA32_001830 [Geitlerinema sp. FC II]
MQGSDRKGSLGKTAIALLFLGVFLSRNSLHASGLKAVEKGRSTIFQRTNSVWWFAPVKITNVNF